MSAACFAIEPITATNTQPILTTPIIPTSATATISQPQLQIPAIISVQNDFIRIKVNGENTNTGRFAVDTVTGDPLRDSDDNKYLIYGEPKPWTSYTTIRIDGENYVFGGETKKRSGKNAKYGEIVSAPHQKAAENIIATEFKFDKIVVEQAISIIKNPTSKLLDTAKITYILRNTDNISHSAGVRIVLDTLLGTNDGAPFRVGEKNITSETMLTKENLVDYWLAFDSLTAPGVIARGTLRADDINLPDKVSFANWGKLADNLWDIPYIEGQTFVRENEEELDSAIAIFWDETVIPPGESRTVSTLYGLEYLNIMGDVLRIGIPAGFGEISTAKNQIKPFPVFAYLNNVSEFELKDVKAVIKLPKGLSLDVDETMEKYIGNLKSKEEKTVGWRIIPTVGAAGVKTITVTGTAAGIEETNNSATVELLAPPGISYILSVPKALEIEDGKIYKDNPFQINVTVKNNGEPPIDNISAILNLPKGLTLPQVYKQDPVQKLPRLDGKQTFPFSWKVIAVGEPAGNLSYTIVITSDSTETEAIQKSIFIPPLSTQLEFEGIPAPAYKSTFLPVDVLLSSVRDFKAFEIVIKFEPASLQVIRISEGTIFVEDNKITNLVEPFIDNKNGIVKIKGSRLTPFSGSGTIATINFRLKEVGKSKISFSDIVIRDKTGNKLSPAIIDSEIEVMSRE